MQILYESDSHLCHHGVKGMKWGHRKQRYAQKQINRYGSKKEAVAALTRKADRGAKRRRFVKRAVGTGVGISGLAGSAGSALAAITAKAAATSVASAGVSAATASGATAALGIIGTVGTMGAAGLLGVGALGITAAVRAKAKHSSKKKKQIETVQNYNKRA